MHKKISIIMPSLNVAPYIRECVDSVRNQSIKDIEIICVDSGSTDGTLEILREYEAKDERIKVVLCEKKSYGAQVNLGISLAQGEYIGIVETDDFIRPDMYEVLYEAIRDTDLDYVKADYEFVQVWQGKYVFKKQNYFPTGSSWYHRVLNTEELLEMYDGKSVVLWTGIYRKDFLREKNIRFNESPGAAYQDVGFFLQVTGRAEKAMYLEDALYCYRLNRPGSSAVDRDCFGKLVRELAWVLETGLLEGEAHEHQEKAVALLLRNAVGQYTIGAGRNNYDWNCYALAEPHRWLAEHMDAFVEQYAPALKEKHGELWGQYRALLSQPEAYTKQLQVSSSWGEQAIQEAKKMDKFVIFGVGQRGKSFLWECLSENVPPVAITDNDQQRWGQKLFEFPILPPQECVRKYKAANYIIANKLHGQEILEQLVALGVDRANIWQ